MKKYEYFLGFQLEEIKSVPVNEILSIGDADDISTLKVNQRTDLPDGGWMAWININREVQERPNHFGMKTNDDYIIIYTNRSWEVYTPVKDDVFSHYPIGVNQYSRTGMLPSHLLRTRYTLKGFNLTGVNIEWEGAGAEKAKKDYAFYAESGKDFFVKMRFLKFGMYISRGEVEWCEGGSKKKEQVVCVSFGYHGPQVLASQTSWHDDLGWFFD